MVSLSTEFELLAIDPIGNIHQSHRNVRLVLGGETESKYKFGHNSRSCVGALHKQVASAGERMYTEKREEQRTKMWRPCLGEPPGNSG